MKAALDALPEPVRALARRARLPECVEPMKATWSEVEDRVLDPRAWSIKSAVACIEGEPDPWKGWKRRARSLTKARKRLDAMRADLG